MVSTMHKVKGKEFDQVFLLLDDFWLSSAESARVVYVAITRPKVSLEIHTHLPIFDNFDQANFEVEVGKGAGSELQILTLNASLRDVVLSHFQKTESKSAAKELHAGDKLEFYQLENQYGAICPHRGNIIVRFSRRFRDELDTFFQKGYELSAIKVDHIVVWWDEKTDQHLRIVLPEVELKKT